MVYGASVCPQHCLNYLNLIGVIAEITCKCHLFEVWELHFHSASKFLIFIRKGLIWLFR